MLFTAPRAVTGPVSFAPRGWPACGSPIMIICVPYSRRSRYTDHLTRSGVRHSGATEAMTTTDTIPALSA
jgi:hypothetical protein